MCDRFEILEKTLKKLFQVPVTLRNNNVGITEDEEFSVIKWSLSGENLFPATTSQIFYKMKVSFSFQLLSRK